MTNLCEGGSLSYRCGFSELIAIGAPVIRENEYAWCVPVSKTSWYFPTLTNKYVTLTASIPSLIDNSRNSTGEYLVPPTDVWCITRISMSSESLGAPAQNESYRMFLLIRKFPNRSHFTIYYLPYRKCFTICALLRNRHRGISVPFQSGTAPSIDDDNLNVRLNWTCARHALKKLEH